MNVHQVALYVLRFIVNFSMSSLHDVTVSRVPVMVQPKVEKVSSEKFFLIWGVVHLTETSHAEGSLDAVVGSSRMTQIRSLVPFAVGTGHIVRNAVSRPVQTGCCSAHRLGRLLSDSVFAAFYSSTLCVGWKVACCTEVPASIWHCGICPRHSRSLNFQTKQSTSLSPASKRTINRYGKPI